MTSTTKRSWKFDKMIIPYHVKVTKTRSGFWIGQLVEIPSIMIQVKKRENLQSQLEQCLLGYQEAFPEKSLPWPDSVEVMRFTVPIKEKKRTKGDKRPHE